MKRSVLIACIVWAVASSCSNKVLLPQPRYIQTGLFGAQIKFRERGSGAMVNGELIAVKDTLVYILASFHDTTSVGRHVQAVGLSSIKNAKLKVAKASNHPGTITAWACVLPLVCISHGLLAAFTFPITFAAGTAIAIETHTSTMTIKYPRKIKSADLHRFARFPQGIPEHLDLKKIK